MDCVCTLSCKIHFWGQSVMYTRVELKSKACLEKLAGAVCIVTIVTFH